MTAWHNCPTCGAGPCIGPRETCPRVPDVALSAADRHTLAVALDERDLQRAAHGSHLALTWEQLGAIIDVARDEGREAGRRTAYESSVYEHLRRRAADLFAEGKQARRVELTEFQIGRLSDEAEAMQPFRSEALGERARVVRINTAFGVLDVVEASRPAICWRRPGRSYGDETWERDPL